MTRILLVAVLTALCMPAQAQKKDADGPKQLKPEAGPARMDVFDEGETEQSKGLTALKKKDSDERQAYIKRTRSRIKKGGGSRAPILFRLAEAEWEEAKYQYQVQGDRFDKQMDMFDKVGGKKPVEPKPNYRSAVEVYQKLLREHPTFGRLDQVYFRLGKTLIAESKKQQGTSYMKRLTEKYPRSKYNTEANFLIAEFRFDGNMMSIAEIFYKKVLADKPSKQYPYALYKMGYVHYNQEKYEESIVDFHAVVALARSGDKRGVTFENQGLNALVTSYAEVKNGWERARDYFSKMGDAKFVRSKLQMLAKVMKSQGKDDDEVSIYEYLIALDKKHPSIAEYAVNLTANYNRRSLFKDEEKTINRFVQFLDPSRSWYLKNRSDDVARVRSNQYRDEQINHLIDHYYGGAQKLDEKKRFPEAKVLYVDAAKYFEMYIGLFPNKTKELYEKEFFLAEIYYFQTSPSSTIIGWNIRKFITS